MVLHQMCRESWRYAAQAEPDADGRLRGRTTASRGVHAVFESRLVGALAMPMSSGNVGGIRRIASSTAPDWTAQGLPGWPAGTRLGFGGPCRPLPRRRSMRLTRSSHWRGERVRVRGKAIAEDGAPNLLEIPHRRIDAVADECPPSPPGPWPFSPAHEFGRQGPHRSPAGERGRRTVCQNPEVHQADGLARWG